MNRQIEPSKRGRRTARGLALGLVTLVVGSAAVLLAPVAATAAPVSAITDVQITNPPPLVAQTPYTVEATWAVDDSAQSGDTFTLDFPDSMTGYVNSFDLKDEAGATVGTCDVAAGTFLCTLGEYVDTHSNVHGTLHFQARFTEAVEEEEVIFTADNDVKISAPVPGGVGVPDSTTPQGPQKWGFVNNDGESMTWVLTVPAEYLDAAGGAPVTVVDTYDAALTFDAAASSARWTYDADWGNSVWHPVVEGSGAETYSVVNDAAAHTFTVTFNQPVTSNDRLYQFVTVMDFPANAQDGQSFGNTMKIADRTITAKPVVYVSSGGTGTGDGFGAFDVTKTVTGTGATMVKGTEYTVNYSYTVDGVATTGELTLTDGATDGLADLPEGTVITLSEVTATGTGVTYGTPVYTGTGVTDNGDGTASFTITDDTIAIALENPVTTVPPTVPPTVPEKPGNPGGSLAITGADSGPFLAIGGATLAAGLALLIARRLRRRG